MSDRVAEQKRYYAERAPEYDDWWYRRGRYELDREELARWQADVAELDAALDAFAPRGSVLERLRPAQVWMVGDNVVADVLGAEALGVPAVLVRRPDPRAARYADSLADVPAFLVDEAAAA